MRVYRIEITSWTASFRYPNVISGYQPTLLVPPLSTVLGMINACAGKYLDYKDEEIGYYFEYFAKSEDLETIYQIEAKDGIPKKDVKSNVIRREFLYDCKLFVYLKNPELVNNFRHPYFQLLLGRSNDLATIRAITERDLQKKKNASNIRGQIIPFMGNFLPGAIQALPQYFTDALPRENLGTQPYSVISYDADEFETSLTAYTDVIDNKEINIYFHKINFEGK